PFSATRSIPHTCTPPSATTPCWQIWKKPGSCATAYTGRKPRCNMMHMKYTNKRFRARLAGFCLALLPFALQAQTVRSEYDIINYERPAVDNPVADLVAGLASGELTLEFRPPFGYLESLLEALGISP